MDVVTRRWDPSQATAGLPEPDDRDTLVIAFGSAAMLADDATIRRLLARYPRAHAIGCSTAGEIVGDRVFDSGHGGAPVHDHGGGGGLAVGVVRFDHTRLVSDFEPVPAPEHSFRAGVNLARRLTDREPDLCAVLVLSDGLRVNGSALAAGVVQGTHGRVPILGGLAGDDDRFGRTWVLAGGEPRSGYVTAVGLAGPKLAVGHGSQGGWRVFGPVRRITRSEGNILHELDGEPALELYGRYLGERACGMPATALLFPLAVQVPGAEGRTVVRTVLSVDRTTRTMTFAGDVPVGSTAQLMTSELDRLVEGAAAAAAEARGRTTVSPALALAVSCVGRRLVLGRRTEDETEAVLSQLAPGTELIGFYSYGELAPVPAGSCDLQNQTMTVTTIAETG